jgi:FtsZ-binding cell division protein ZapB
VIDWVCTYQVGKIVIIPAEYANKILKNIYKQLKFKAMGNESNKMTAVEWLIKQLTPSISLQQKHIDELKEKAKQMERQQMCKFAYKCHNHYKVNGDFKIEDYYEQTYGGNK